MTKARTQTRRAFLAHGAAVAGTAAVGLPVAATGAIADDAKLLALWGEYLKAYKPYIDAVHVQSEAEERAIEDARPHLAAIDNREADWKARQYAKRREDWSARQHADGIEQFYKEREAVRRAADRRHKVDAHERRVDAASDKWSDIRDKIIRTKAATLEGLAIKLAVEPDMTEECACAALRDACRIIGRDFEAERDAVQKAAGTARKRA